MKLSFNLTNHGAKITHLNVREEKHGDEPIIAIDIKIETDVHNDFLSYLSPTLKWSLYSKNPNQGELIEDETHLPALRYQELGLIGWDGEMDKAMAVFHGAKKSDDIDLECEVDKLRFTCRDGGTVTIVFRIKVLPTPAQSAMLMCLLGKETRISVRPLDAEEFDERPAG